ncbi:MAG: hypothetical protein P8L85_22145 [Rubripirellula sp.]|nr:hypothetical protein [Rubripirellula sp.]
MDRYTNPIWTFDISQSFKIMIIATVLIGLTSYRATQGEYLAPAPGQADRLSHTFHCPKVLPDFSSTTCTNYAAQYAAALADLQKAHMAADVAYRAWYECEYGGRQSPTLTERSGGGSSFADFSVLVEQP